MIFKVTKDTANLTTKETFLKVLEEAIDKNNTTDFNAGQIIAMINKAVELDTILIGDVVKTEDNKYCVVTQAYADKGIEVLNADGLFGYLDFEEYEITGRHFDEFSYILDELRIMGGE